MELRATGFGWIQTDRARLAADIVIYPDERLALRRSVPDRHIVERAELERVLAGTEAVLVLGSGQYGAMKIAPGAEEYLRRRGIRFHILPTPEAIKLFNRLKPPRAGIFHVTC